MLRLVGNWRSCAHDVCTASSFLSRQFPTHTRSSGVGTDREIGTATLYGGLAPLGALAMVSNSPTHSTTGVVVDVIIAAVVLVVAASFDQEKHSNFKIQWSSTLTVYSLALTI